MVMAMVMAMIIDIVLMITILISIAKQPAVTGPYPISSSQHEAEKESGHCQQYSAVTL